MPPKQEYRCDVCGRYSSMSRFSLPSDPDLNKEWRQRLRIEESEVLKVSFKVCDEHFLPGQFSLSSAAKRKTLQPGAVPSKFLPFPDLSLNNPELTAISPDVPLDEARRSVILAGHELLPMACNCRNVGPEPGNVYSHIVHGGNVASVIQTLQTRTGLPAETIRVEVVDYLEKPLFGKTDCVQLGATVFRRTGTEMILSVLKRRPGHTCDFSFVGIAIVIFGVLKPEKCFQIYDDTRKTALSHAAHQTRPAIEPKKGCQCSAGGINRLFGCGYSIYFPGGGGGCKWFCPNTPARKFDFESSTATPSDMELFESNVNGMANIVGRLVAKFCPEAHRNMTAALPEARACRIGHGNWPIFSTVNIVADVSAHGHYDDNNQRNGLTAIVVTTRRATKNLQYHVLPSYGVNGQKGIAFELPMGSVLLENAREELHSSTKLREPDGQHPNRLGFVFLLHKRLVYPNHGIK